MNKEIEIKWNRIRNLIECEKIDALLISKISNFAWFTGGKVNYVGIHTETGVCKLLITKEKIYYLANNIEYPRISEEELKNFNFEPIIKNWYEENFDEEIKKIIPGKVVPDTNLNIEDLHFPLLPEEIERFKKLGKETAISIRELAEEIKVGNREIEVAGRLCEKLWGKNIIPITILIASDERIKKFRHPIPKDKKIKKYVMLVVCARREGLIVSLTRFVHFGKINNELRKKHIAVCRIDAHFINSTRVGETIGNVFCKGIEMYEKTGYKEEWKKHHQGGLTGYLTRYFRATEKSSKIIIENMAFAWNPSITGTKSEDTIITNKEKPIIITEDKNWPMLKININDMEILRPDIMIK